jgi:hypothetical protein
MEKFWLPQDWQPKKFHHHTNCDRKDLITTILAIEFWSLQDLVMIEKILHG